MQRYALVELVAAPRSEGDAIAEPPLDVAELRGDVDTAITALVDASFVHCDGERVWAVPAALRFDQLSRCQP